MAIPYKRIITIDAVPYIADVYKVPEIEAANLTPNRTRPACVSPKYRAPLDAATVAKMRHMRREGFTISECARAGKCTWRTAWARTKGCSK